MEEIKKEGTCEDCADCNNCADCETCDECNKDECECGDECSEGCCEGMCKCIHHNILPISVIIIAVSFLLGSFGILSAQVVGIIWPIFAIISALTMMFGHKCKCC